MALNDYVKVYTAERTLTIDASERGRFLEIDEHINDGYVTVIEHTNGGRPVRTLRVRLDQVLALDVKISEREERPKKQTIQLELNDADEQ